VVSVRLKGKGDLVDRDNSNKSVWWIKWSWVRWAKLQP